jgi:hemoglobin-like flavoprotein
MTPEHIALVQGSFADVLPIADTAAALFYERLFVLDPTLRSLFHGDMREQGRKLMAMLHMVVTGLRRLEELVPSVQQLGVRHPGGWGRRGNPSVAAVTTPGMERGA